MTNLRTEITEIINSERYDAYTSLDNEMVIEDLEKLGWSNIKDHSVGIYAEKDGKKFYVDFENVDWNKK